MTEQEIIKRLKDNKEMGTPYFFLPEAVRDYLLKHAKESFLIFDNFYKEWKLSNGIDCLNSSLYALPDFKPHWEELNIENGVFRFNDEGYQYWEVERFLSNYIGYFNAFGGWLLKDPATNKKVWTTSRQVKYEKYITTLCDEDDDVEPIFPSKIRFWRFKE